MNQLIRLVYASRSVVTPSATHQGMDPAIARILAKSRKNNARLDVVGGLLFGDGYFLQCLEGDLRIVQNLYSKIENDPRHRDVTVLLQASISTRTSCRRQIFTSRSMGKTSADGEVMWSKTARRMCGFCASAASTCWQSSSAVGMGYAISSSRSSMISCLYSHV